MRNINKIVNIVAIVTIIMWSQSACYSMPDSFTLRVPSIFSFQKLDYEKDWGIIERDYKVLIEAAFSEEELKRVYRKMVFETHPDRNKGDEKNAEEVFKKLAGMVEGKLKKDFKVTPANSSKHAYNPRWMDDWASVTPEYEKDNMEIMAASVNKLKDRAQRLADVIKGKELAIEVLAKKAAYLSASDIDQLLDVISKKSFAALLINKIQPDALSAGLISDEDIWQIRPLLEKLLLARQLRTGEIVLIRTGNKIERAVILEEFTGEGSKLKAITVGAPFKGPLDYGSIGSDNSRLIELAADYIVSDLVDFEREPKQTGYTINIGDILEIDNREDPPFMVTVYGVHAHFYHVIMHQRSGSLSYHLGYGYHFGTAAGETALGDGRIKKINLTLPEIKPRLDNIEILKRLPQRGLRTDS
ncbi:MAG: DnaJ domain-containing protein [Candidatus Omnitrophota bacterium]|jgi:hypothetical protein